MIGGIIGKIVGKQVVVPAITAVGSVLDNLFTSDEEKLDKKALLMKIAQQPTMVQAEINKVEASHRSRFVAGWRPFVGWVCGVALLWHFMLYDILSWVTVNFFPHVTNIPQLTGTESLMTVLMALLGFGGYRTFEKTVGRSK